MPLMLRLIQPVATPIVERVFSAMKIMQRQLRNQIRDQ